MRRFFSSYGSSTGADEKEAAELDKAKQAESAPPVENWGVFACGGNNRGQLGLGDLTNKSTFHPLPLLVDNCKLSVRQIVAGDEHTVILTGDARVFSTGQNGSGQLGVGDTSNRSAFIAVPPLPSAKLALKVVAGSTYTMVLSEDGTLFACGGNDGGQLGLGDTTDRDTLTAVRALPGGEIPKQVAAGVQHTVILTLSGAIFGSGVNQHGQLGLPPVRTDGSNVEHYVTFKRVANAPLLTTTGDGSSARIFAGGFHTMLLADDGSLFACGRNGRGQLGMGDNDDRDAFAAVPTPPTDEVVVDVSTGYSHTVLLTGDGGLLACGSNDSGRLGLGDGASNRNSFTAIPALPEGKVASKVFACRVLTSVLCKDGTVFVSGWNYHGELGLGDFRDRNTLTAVPFFGPDHPGLVPWTSPLSCSIFAATLEREEFASAPLSLVVQDIASLTEGDDLLHFDLTLLSGDQTSVDAHRAMLQVRCPKLLQQGASSIKSDDVAAPSTGESERLEVNVESGRMLAYLVRFLYDDKRPDFGELDGERTSTGEGTRAADGAKLPPSLRMAFELMLTAKGLSGPDDLAMYHLQALCEQYVMNHITEDNVIPLLVASCEASYDPMRYACFELLAREKPGTDPTMTQQLCQSMAVWPEHLATAVIACSGVPPTQSFADAPTKIPASSRLSDAMKLLWRRAAAVSRAERDKRAASSGGASNEAAAGLPDCVVTIGSEVRLRADRFILASRSQYFRAALGCGPNSFVEAEKRQVNLEMPQPLPSTAAAEAVLRFIYLGSIWPEPPPSSSTSSLPPSSTSAAPLNSVEALDVLYMTGTEDGGGYLQLSDNSKLRAEAESLIDISDEDAFALLRRASVMGQESVKSSIFERLQQSDCSARPSLAGLSAEEPEEDRSKEWWSKDHEIAMCHELIDVLMTSLSKKTLEAEAAEADAEETAETEAEADEAAAPAATATETTGASADKSNGTPTTPAAAPAAAAAAAAASAE